MRLASWKKPGVEQGLDGFEGSEGGVTLFFVTKISNMEGEPDVCGVTSGFRDCSVGGSQFGNGNRDGEDCPEIRHVCRAKARWEVRNGEHACGKDFS